MAVASDGEPAELGLSLETQTRVSNLPIVGAEPADQAEEEYEPSEARAADGAGVDQRGVVDRLYA